MSSKLDRTITFARWAILWERLWAAAFPALLVVALFAILAFSGLIALLPELARLAALALFAIASILSLVPLFRLRAPTRSESLRRVELASALDHRPVAAVTDRLAHEFV